MFAFINKNGERMSLNEIDKLACKFWGVQYSSEYYASPSMGDINWFDLIGHAIEDLQYAKSTYDNQPYYIWALNRKDDSPKYDMSTVAAMLSFKSLRLATSSAEFYEMSEFIRPYINLCYHLRDIGITAEARGW